VRSHQRQALCTDARGGRTRAALDAAGIGSQVRQLPASTRTATQAAAALQAPVAAIANSLVSWPTTNLCWCSRAARTRSTHQVDCSHLAPQCGARTLQRATAQQVRTATGQAIGGVAPVGHPRRLRTFLDLQLAAEPVIWAAAGTSHSVFATTYNQLQQLCSAQPVTVTAEVGTSPTAVQPDDDPEPTTSAVPAPAARGCPSGANSTVRWLGRPRSPAAGAPSDIRQGSLRARRSLQPGGRRRRSAVRGGTWRDTRLARPKIMSSGCVQRPHIHPAGTARDRLADGGSTLTTGCRSPSQPTIHVPPSTLIRGFGVRVPGGAQHLTWPFTDIGGRPESSVTRSSVQNVFCAP